METQGSGSLGLRSIARSFWSVARACRLCLVLPQMWLWTMLRAIDAAGTAGASNLVFYLAEGAALAIVAFALGVAAARPTGAIANLVRSMPVRTGAGVFLGLMALAPALVLVGARFELLGLAIGAEIVGAAGLVTCYATYFALFATLSVRDAARALLVSFALVPLMRLPLDILPIGGAALFSVVLPPLFALALRTSVRGGDRIVHNPMTSAEGPGREAHSERWRTLAILGIELVAFGLAMGLFRTQAGGIHDSLWYVLLNFVLKTALPLLVLAAVERWGRQVSLAGLCQAALALLTILMVIAVNLQGVPAVPFVVFDLARYVMIVLIFLALVAMGHRFAPSSPVHPDAQHAPAAFAARPVALFAACLGAYTLALAAGLALAGALGTGAPDSATLVLDIVCVLVLCTALASGAGRADDVRLFADGSPELAPSQTPDEIETRCNAAGTTYALSERELETMKLICRGRSKRYIAEQMALSENTVRGYAKTLYAKLDIHSRQELMTLVGIE